MCTIRASTVAGCYEEAQTLYDTRQPIFGSDIPVRQCKQQLDQICEDWWRQLLEEN